MSIHPLLHGALPLSSLKACPIDAQGEMEKSKKKKTLFLGFPCLFLNTTLEGHDPIFTHHFCCSKSLLGFPCLMSTDFDFEEQK